MFFYIYLYISDAHTLHEQGPEDDEEAFSFHPPMGHIKGTANRPTRPAVQMVTVEFHPKVATRDPKFET